MSYLITRDGPERAFSTERTVPTLEILATFTTRKEAIAGCRELEHGQYTLVSILRDFEVRDSQRVVQRVVEWGPTSQPRKRKAKGANGSRPRSTRKKAKLAITEERIEA